MVVRFADDNVLGFQYKADADRFLVDFQERLGKFGLELNPDKTRRIEFGRFAEQNRLRRGEGKPETFDFLGFTHISGKNRKGYFVVKRQTIGKRMRAKLEEIKTELKARMHDSIVQTGKWLKSVVQGYFNYHAVPDNTDSLRVFRFPGDLAVAASINPPWPKASSELGANATTGGTMAAGPACYCSPLSRRKTLAPHIQDRSLMRYGFRSWGSVQGLCQESARSAMLLPEMKGGPSKPAYQELVSNSRKLLPFNDGGGERDGKGVRKSRHVRAREANASEPLMRPSTKRDLQMASDQARPPLSGRKHSGNLVTASMRCPGYRWRDSGYGSGPET